MTSQRVVDPGIEVERETQWDVVEHPQARILVVDDDRLNTQIMSALLEGAGYTHVLCLNDSRLVVPTIETWSPDLVLLDLHMPEPDGLQLLELLNGRTPVALRVPIIVLTSDGRPENRDRALSLGAIDFITKPVDQTESLLRIRNQVAIRTLQLELQRRNQTLEERVMERTYALERSHLEMLQRLATAAELRDDETGQHTLRVGHSAGILARTAGLPPDAVDLLRQAAPLHDVGKIGVPDAVLRKPASLTPEEVLVMRRHTLIGAQLLGEGHSPVMCMAEIIALSHHERWDGTGYPHGLAGAAIPLPARIVALADVFDALTHDRPYRSAWSVDAALEEIARSRGTHFDPALTDVFLGLESHEKLL
jgi:putative two-component system response regulator